jgi:hypothetical protein
MADLNSFKRRSRTGLAQHLAKPRFLSNQYDIQAARSNRGKDTLNLDAWRPLRAHRIDSDPDFAQELSSSVFSMTIRSL